MSIKGCALNIGLRNAFMDHITPLASLLNLPVILADEKNVEATRRYYPEVSFRYWPDIQFRNKELAEEFDVLFSCDAWLKTQKIVFGFHTQKQLKLIFCPHGQSDKGYISSLLDYYADQENVLLYGNLMKKMLVDLQIWDKIPRSAVIGNFRKFYFEKHRRRLSKLVDEEYFSRLNCKNRTLCYAPTWNDIEGSGTLLEFGERLLRELPSDWNLLIKIHPNMIEKDPALYYRFSLLEEKRSNFLLIEDFPLIYPLLDKADVYLGDYSSVGYDFLAFQKPMFFLQKPHLAHARLHTCGSVLDASENLFFSIEKELQKSDQFKEAQRELYQQAFSSVEDPGPAIQSLCSY